MQKVKFELDQEIVFNSVRELVQKHECVGFKAYPLGFRYLVAGLPTTIVAVRPQGYWSCPQPSAGEFYIFDSSKELLRWMIGE